MTSQWLPFRQIDAFTRTPAKGNAAGIVTLDEPLTDDQMLAIAREVNLSETAFLLPDPAGEADARIRYFTPTREIPFCGHATIAAMHHLHERWDRDDSPFQGERVADKELRLSSRVGILQGHVDDKDIAWSTTDPTTIAGPWEGAWGDLLLALGNDPSVLADNAEPIATADGVIAIEAKDKQALHHITPDQGILRQLESQGLKILCVWTRHGRAYGTDWHQRVFAPHYGIPEDPVTGMACARMAAILYAEGRLKTMEGEPLPDGPVHLKARQGDVLDRRGIVRIILDRDERGHITRTTIGGHAVVSVEGKIRVPPPKPRGK